MTDPSQLALLLANQLVAALRNKIHEPHIAVSPHSVSLLLRGPIPRGNLSESNVRRVISSMDFGHGDNGPIIIQDLAVRSYKGRVPFGSVATHTTAVVVLLDTERRPLFMKVTLSSEFAGFEVQYGTLR